MKVLHISNSDYHGGAAVAANRLHTALGKTGEVESVFFAYEKNSSKTVSVRTLKHAYYKRRIVQLIDGFPLRFYKKRRSDLPFSSNFLPFTGILAMIRREKPDIVHFHWVGKGLFRIEELNKIKAPVFWTLHDSFLFTGGCHLPGDCTKYTEGCRKCPQLGSEKPHDLSSWNFKRKRRTYTKKTIHCITLSSWMNGNAQRSLLARHFPLHLLPNNLNFDLFRPLAKQSACEQLNLPADKKIIAFGAVNGTSDSNKGFFQLTQALNQLADRSDELELVIFGSEKPETDPFPGFRSHFLGFIRDEERMNLIYNCADVMVVPSLIENLSNVILESLAANTPVVAFNTGGNKDLITHLKNGYLAEKFDVSDLLHGIRHFAFGFDKSDMNRELIQSGFEDQVVAQKYISLYQQALK